MDIRITWGAVSKPMPKSHFSKQWILIKCSICVEIWHVYWKKTCTQFQRTDLSKGAWLTLLTLISLIHFSSLSPKQPPSKFKLTHTLIYYEAFSYIESVSLRCFWITLIAFMMYGFCRLIYRWQIFLLVLISGHDFIIVPCFLLSIF